MDEVGRGALAGPVTVGVVVVTAVDRPGAAGLRGFEAAHPGRPGGAGAARSAAGSTEYAVGHASPAEIDTIGIIGGAADWPAGGRWPRCPARSTRCCWTATTTT